MRAADDMPSRRRPPRTRVPGRGRVVLIVGAAVIFVLLTSLRGLAGFYTDYLWFDSLDLASVWEKVVGTKVALAAVFTATFAVLCYVNLAVADRIAPTFRPSGPEDELLNRYHEMIDRRAGLVRVGVSLLFGLIAGVGVSAQWNQWLLFRNGGDFGVTDATFGVDVGFYVFKLPFITAVIDWLFASLVIILLITVVAHYLNGGIRMQSPLQRVTPQVKAHLSVLLAVLALVKAVDYWFSRYELTFSTRGYVDGATYTDVNAQLPATNLLLLISLLSCALFIVNIWRRGWVLPVTAVGLWALVQIGAGAVYPAVVQRITVEPQESSKEAPYIENNIVATRQALGLDQVETRTINYTADPAAGAEAVVENLATVRNARLLDPAVVKPTYQNLQSLLPFYQFVDLDVDRYPIVGPDGVETTTQVVLSNRDLNLSNVPQQSWEGTHIAYTHGYGLALAPANGTTDSGSPDFLVSDVPYEVDASRIDVPDDLVPQIYFGEGVESGYSVVGTERDEVDYLDPATQQPTTNPYEGTGGVVLDSALRRGAYFLRFNFDWNLILSDFVTPSSRIMYTRDVRQRVSEVAPFLRLDADPYPVVTQSGRIVYLLDAYTTSDSYPNAQRIETGGVNESSGLAGQGFNYVRNSVKAVVDAYDGTVTLYVVDEDDPIVRAYQKAFPDLFADAPMDPELQAHWRFPEDLFTVQTNMWGRYHVDGPQAFYDRSNSWVVAQDPGRQVQVGTGQTQTTIITQGGQPVARSQTPRITPYYQLMRLPGEERESFVILRSFVPYSDEDNLRQLTSFMVADSDPANYGKMISYEMAGGPVDGPALANSTIQGNDEIAAAITLLDQQGSNVSFGEMLLLPLNDTILYVRPLYVTAQGATQVPQLKQVIVVFGKQVVMKPTLREALLELFDVEALTFENQTGEIVPGQEPPPTEPEEPPTSSTTTPGEPSENATVQQLLADADRLYREADEALRRGGAEGFATYQEKITQAAERVRQAQALLAASATTTTTQPQVGA